jgi:osmoprotectant transport system substrate-binding protein
MVAFAAPIEIGTKNFTEQFVVGNLMAVYLEDQGFDVSLRTGMSSTVLREAMETGQVDLCMDYTGTQWLTYTGHEFNGESPEEIYQLAKDSDAEIGLVWLDPIWCNNTYAIAVTREFAETNDVYDLEAFAAYVNDNEGRVPFASDFEFYARPDGILGLQVHYGFAFHPDSVVTVLPGLTFEYLIQGESIAAMVFGTDPQVVKYDWVVLQDTQNFWPPYDLAPIVNEQTLAANPGLEDALNDLIAAFPTDPAAARLAMTELNAMVDIDLMEPEEAAQEWLEDKGLI